MRKSLPVFALLLCLLTVSLCACQKPAAETPKGPSVRLRVEGISELLAFDPEYPLTAELSALDLVCALLDSRDVPYTAEYGYLVSVGHDNAGAFGGFDGFVFYVNGEESLEAPGSLIPKEGDELLFCYADLNGEPPTLWPKVEAIRGADGLVTLLVSGGRMTFVGEQTGMEYTPVAGAEVTVNEVLYHTDAAGKLVLDAELSRRAQVSLQVELYTEDGRPLLIRLAPDYLLDLPR